MKKITAEMFEKAVGSAPIQDDLDRCNCDEVGEPGHWSCGWCDTCNKPYFMCPHLPPRKDKNEHAASIVIVVSNPTHAECVSADRLTQEDVWGVYDDIRRKRVSNGMMVARGYGRVMSGFTQEEKDRLVAEIPEVCPVWGDVLPYKSVTVICPADQEEQVSYWLEYVHGGHSISRRKELPEGKVALRSNYMCW